MTDDRKGKDQRPEIGGRSGAQRMDRGQKEECEWQGQALGRAEALNYERWGGEGSALLEEHCV